MKLTPLDTEGELRCSGMVSSSCSTCDTRRATLVTSAVIRYKWEKDLQPYSHTINNFRKCKIKIMKSLKRRVSHVEQELLTIPEHLSSPSVSSGVNFMLLNLNFLCNVTYKYRSLFVFSGVWVARSSVFCVVFCWSLVVFIGVCAARSSVFCVVFCRSLFVFNGVIYKTLHGKLKIEQHKPH
jgi:hypothetical protein